MVLRTQNLRRRDTRPTRPPRLLAPRPSNKLSIPQLRIYQRAPPRFARCHVNFGLLMSVVDLHPSRVAVARTRLYRLSMWVLRSRVSSTYRQPRVIERPACIPPSSGMTASFHKTSRTIRASRLPQVITSLSIPRRLSRLRDLYPRFRLRLLRTQFAEVKRVLRSPYNAERLLHQT